MKNKGIVVKIKDSYCIMLSGDGTYHKIPRSRVSNPIVGAESEFSAANWAYCIKPFLMVACLLVAVLSLNFYRTAASADPAAFVALDINPSMELGVDKNSKVVTVSALNQDAENLLKDLDIKGQDLYAAIRQVLDDAAASGYIKAEETNYILSTVTPNGASSSVIDYNKMAENLQSAVPDKNLDINFVILSADKTTRKEAKDKGISTGKLLVYKNSIESGTKVSLEQVKQTSVTTLVKNNKVLLLPGKKKGFVKLIRVPRKNGHLKKSGSKTQDDVSKGNPDQEVPLKQADRQDIETKLNRVIKPKPDKKDKTRLVKLGAEPDPGQSNETNSPDKEKENKDKKSKGSQDNQDKSQEKDKDNKKSGTPKPKKNNP